MDAVEAPVPLTLLGNSAPSCQAVDNDVDALQIPLSLVGISQGNNARLPQTIGAVEALVQTSLLGNSDLGSLAGNEAPSSEAVGAMLLQASVRNSKGSDGSLRKTIDAVDGTCPAIDDVVDAVQNPQSMEEISEGNHGSLSQTMDALEALVPTSVCNSLLGKEASSKTY